MKKGGPRVALFFCPRRGFTWAGLSSAPMMPQFSFVWAGWRWEVVVDAPVDASCAVGPVGPRAWYVEAPRFEPVRANGFVGAVAEGGAVNFRDLAFNPHGHGTHTECLGHITQEVHSVNACRIPAWIPCLLVSVVPDVLADGDHVLGQGAVQRAVGAAWAALGLPSDAPMPPAVAVRTLPNEGGKARRNWSDTNPAYFEAGVLAGWAAAGVDHLLTDLPSVDRERDGGVLAGHHAFWCVPDAPRFHATITEFLNVPNDVPDGLYLLNLQTAAFENDATPSRPLLFPCAKSIPA